MREEFKNKYGDFSIENIDEVYYFVGPNGKLENSFADLYTNLRKLRNRAAHSPELDLDMAEAIRFVDLALGLANRLKSLTKTKNEVE